MCPNSAPRPCRAQAQTQRYNRVCESLSWVSSRKKVRETCQTQLTFSDSLSALPSYIVSDTFSVCGRARLKPISQEEEATVLWYDKPVAKWSEARAGKSNELPGSEKGAGWDAFSAVRAPGQWNRAKDRL